MGKAKRLKNRVTSYFRPGAQHLPKVEQMVQHADHFRYIVTASEEEALLLECSLIKQYKPKYNILLKDDKGYSYIKISPPPYSKLTAEYKNDTPGNIWDHTTPPLLQSRRWGGQPYFQAAYLPPSLSCQLPEGAAVPQLLYRPVHGGVPRQNQRTGV